MVTVGVAVTSVVGRHWGVVILLFTTSAVPHRNPGHSVNPCCGWGSIELRVRGVSAFFCFFNSQLCSNEHLHPIHDLFATAEACLLADVIQMAVDSNIPFVPFNLRQVRAVLRVCAH
jgi:hypothetical protein